ncbi:MAG: extracellular solute-binding protein [Chromatiales bacterium]|jgi:multiple sugar transport system substrate-binding protein
MEIKTHAGSGRPALLCHPILALLLLLISLFSTGCGRQTPESADLVLEVWAHAGQESERRTLESQVARFNQAHAELQVRLTLVPEGSYNAQVQSAAVAGELPDLLEFDGPFLYAYVWQGRLRPLDDLLPKSLLDDLLPSILEQGRYRGRLWSVGTFDSGLGLYANAARLKAADIRIPTLAQPWQADEFEEILDRLARDDPDGQVLDLKLNYAGEWYTYAFSPLLQSAGGDLIARPAFDRAEGVLNGTASVDALTRIQRWIERGRVDPNIDDAAFTTGRVALAMGGHWNYPRYSEQLAEDLLLLPQPDLGQGNRTGQGSWSWAVTAGSEQAEAAARFLAFLLQPEEVLAMSGANGAVPATRSAITRSTGYREGGAMRLFVDQLEGGHAVPRPRTPAYPVITAEFQKAFERIRSGSPVKATLDEAARVIDQEIADNQGYP